MCFQQLRPLAECDAEDGRVVEGVSPLACKGASEVVFEHEPSPTTVHVDQKDFGAEPRIVQRGSGRRHRHSTGVGDLWSCCAGCSPARSI